MHINCIKCGTSTSIENNIDLKSFGCPSCCTFFTFEGELKLIRTYDYNAPNPVLEIGKKGIIKEVEYEIINRVIKNFHSIYYWREYTLKSKDNNFLYLTESDGHWILLKEIEEIFPTHRKFKKLTYNNVVYNLYEHNPSCKTVAVTGFFDYVVPNSVFQIVEYVNGTNIISIEKLAGKETTYYGRHFSKSEVKSAFGNLELPSKSGVGMVQPFLFHFSNTAIIFCCVAILILVTQILFNQNRSETQILSKSFAFSEYDNKEYVSESFTLEGGSAPMTISISSDVNNSWANAQVALVNEKTNEEEYANKDLEYYHGYEGGESWSEGSQGEKFNICGVAEGKYHLVIAPQKQPDSSNQELKVNVVWKEPSLWNFFISVLVMGITLLILFFANKNFEQRRWESSDYSPFE